MFTSCAYIEYHDFILYCLDGSVGAIDYKSIFYFWLYLSWFAKQGFIVYSMVEKYKTLVLLNSASSLYYFNENI